LRVCSRFTAFGLTWPGIRLSCDPRLTPQVRQGQPYRPHPRPNGLGPDGVCRLGSRSRTHKNSRQALIRDSLPEPERLRAPRTILPYPLARDGCISSSIAGAPVVER
jgi:hypothetical protein